MTTYLITGANRGLGLGLVKSLLQRPKSTVIAAVRDTSSKSSKALKDLPKAAGARVIIVKIDSTSETDAKDAVAELQRVHGITSLDVVIANAGISTDYIFVADAPLSAFRNHFEINLIGSVVLFQAVLPLLKQSATGNPKFVAVSSAAASISEQETYPMRNAAYGASKAGLNFVVRKAHFENPWLTAFLISPGWVDTDMGREGATSHGRDKAPVAIEDSIAGQLDRIDRATRDTVGGTLQDFENTEPWRW